ncbi:hypothetical protein [Pedobacter sp.]
MKKMLFLAAFAAASLFANAQDSKTNENNDFKPSKGSFATELNFNPFKGNLSFNNVLNQVKGRYFVSANLALRLGFNVNTLDSNLNYGNPYGAQSNFSSDERKSTSFGLNIGIEKHFKGTKRLSPYIGADAFWGTRSAKQTISNNGSTTNVKNGWLDVTYVQSGSGLVYTYRISEGAYSRFGISAVAGFDFYMAKNFFLGYEFNLGYSKTDFKSPDVTITGQSTSFTNYYSNNSTSKFGTSLVNGIRIGYIF